MPFATLIALQRAIGLSIPAQAELLARSCGTPAQAYATICELEADWLDRVILLAHLILAEPSWEDGIQALAISDGIAGESLALSIRGYADDHGTWHP